MSNIQNYLSPPLAVVSGGTGTTTAFTLGSVIFAGDSGVYNQNNANFFWDNTTNRLGIGTTNPTQQLQVTGNSAGSAGITVQNTGTGNPQIRFLNSAGVEKSALTFDNQGTQGGGWLVSSNGTSNTMVVTSAGNVGIGTTNPTRTLQVAGTIFSSGTGINVFMVNNGKYYGSRNSADTNDIGLLRLNSANIIEIGQASTYPIAFFDNIASEAVRITGGNVGIGTTNPNRLLHIAGRYQLGGTVISTTDWALTSGWGANATISAVTGTDSRGTVTVTTSALDTPSANPVITLTFKDGTWTTTPFCIVSMDHASTGPSTVPVTCQATATTLLLSYRGTPTATSTLTYKFNYFVVG